jgi:hypothetical protein
VDLDVLVREVTLLAQENLAQKDLTAHSVCVNPLFARLVLMHGISDIEVEHTQKQIAVFLI